MKSICVIGSNHNELEEEQMERWDMWDMKKDCVELHEAEVKGVESHEAEVKVSGELVIHLQQMVNNPDFSDVVFVCNDAERVHASRFFLSGRSDVLNGMFRNGMAESSLSEIKLPLISSPVLLCVLEFLYTGTLSKYYPRNWRMSWELIRASQFFLIPSLNMKAREFIVNHINSVVEDLPAVATLLTEAMEWKFMCDEMDVHFQHLVKILSSKWSEQSYVQNLSEEAFHYLLSSSNDENDDRLSFEEYLRFRQVMRWWIFQSDLSVDADGALDMITVDEERALSMIKTKSMKSVERPEGTVVHLSDVQSSLEESRDKVDRLLQDINFLRIHPILFATVVKPLKIISSEEMLNLFECHALRKTTRFQREYCDWKCGQSYAKLHRGYVISQDYHRIGVAVMMAPMSSSSPIYEWSFYIEELPLSSFFQLGFTCQNFRVDGATLSELQDSTLVLQSCRGSGIQIRSNDDLRMSWKRLQRSLMGGSTVTFSFDTYKGTCSVNVDEKDYGIVWERIPRRTYYPAVCLGDSDDGRVRIELLTGFDA